MKKKVFLLTMLLSLLLLSGCGVNLSSKIKLNKDFSGTRTMSCTFSSRDFNAYFKGSKEDLNKLIKESCPDSLTYTSSSDGENDTYTFHLWMIIRKKLVIFLIFRRISLMNMEILHL